MQITLVLLLIAYTKFSKFNNDSIRAIIGKLFLKALKLVHLRILIIAELNIHINFNSDTNVVGVYLLNNRHSIKQWFIAVRSVI